MKDGHDAQGRGDAGARHTTGEAAPRDHIADRPDCRIVLVEGRRAGFVIVPRYTPEEMERVNARRIRDGKRPWRLDKWSAMGFRHGHQWDLGSCDSEDEARRRIVKLWRTGRI